MGRLFFFYSLVCFFFLSESFSSSFVHHLCSPSEASALLQFKQSFQISDFPKCYDEEYQPLDFPRTMSWTESRDCCTWAGVTCDMLTGHVIDLDLSCSLLDGTVHPNSSLFQLHHLHTLNLAYNHFDSSPIPNAIGLLRNLRDLNLSVSHFDGKIPTEISSLSKLASLDLSCYDCNMQLDQKTFEKLLHNLTNLEVISLSHVNISFPIPMNFSSSLRYMDLADTNLQGVLPESCFLLPNLERLKLDYNHHLKGFLPKIHPSSTLLELSIAGTGISGELPSSIGTLSSLNLLDLYGCQFSGSIPDSVGNLTLIRQLDFSKNNFTNHIPSTISKWKHLTLLDLRSNSLQGDIPDVFSNLQNLVGLFLSNNSFTGPFPSSILSLKNLQSLDLSSNSLSGPLPSNASMLQNLVDLDLSHNSLNATIPSWVFNINSSELMLDHNQFNGIADVLKTNPTLTSLDLSHNQLGGPFPQSLVNLINLTDLYLSSNNITDDGGIEVFKTMKTLETVVLSYNPLSWKTNTNGSEVTFPSLKSLHLSSCELNDFPHFLRNVTDLFLLDLSNNKIHSQIPNWFSSMWWENLWFLNLSQNSLTGHSEQFHYYRLEYLDLKFNFLQGPLPSSICNMSSLSFLDLSHNYFSHSVPNCFSNMSHLVVLDLRRNNFTGSLPPLCDQSTSLSTIALNCNRFEGIVPMSLLNCDGLKVLDVGHNALTGTFPVWLGTLQELQVLILKSNKFHGPITTRQKNFFPRLRIFDISYNEFTGSLPTEFFQNFKAMIKLDGTNKGKIKYIGPDVQSMKYLDSVRLVIKGRDIELERITTIMTAMDLSSNHFEGVIPKTITDLGALWLLNLSHNNLRGGIPMEMGQLNTLEALDLSWNRFTGKIPQELTRLTFLQKLNLSQNVLVGPIPHGQQFNTFENDSYGGNLDLCGPPLSKQCGTTDASHFPQPLEEEEENESYFFSGFTWESVVIGYSFGLVVGTVLWSLMFKDGKPKWFVEFFAGIFPHKRRRPR